MTTQVEGEGATPLDPDESEGLLPNDIVTREELDEWEQANIAQAEAWLAGRRKRLAIKGILDVKFVRQLHARMFGETWAWAGTFRLTGKSIGAPAAQITERLHNLLADTASQVEHAALPLDEIAMAFHHRLVSIHPFPNGNGRHARLMTDILLVSLGRDRFTWGSASLTSQGDARAQYLAALRAADRGELGPLKAFVRS